MSNIRASMIRTERVLKATATACLLRPPPPVEGCHPHRVARTESCSAGPLYSSWYRWEDERVPHDRKQEVEGRRGEQEEGCCSGIGFPS